VSGFLRKKLFKVTLFALLEVFCGLKYAKNALAAGAELMTLSQTPKSVGEGDTPSSIPTPLGAFGTSIFARLRRSASVAPNVKSWLRRCLLQLLGANVCCFLMAFE